MMDPMFFTTDPKVVFDRLVTHGWMVVDPSHPLGYRPAAPHLDIAEVPNPFLQSLGPPPVPMPQRALSIRVSYQLYANEIAGEPQTGGDGKPLPMLDSTKLGKWVKANSAPADVAVFFGGQPVTLKTRKITGFPVWFVDADQVYQYVHNWQ